MYYVIVRDGKTFGGWVGRQEVWNDRLDQRTLGMPTAMYTIGGARSVVELLRQRGTIGCTVHPIVISVIATPI